MAGCGYNIPTSELLNKTKMLSINQLVAYTTLVSVFKIKKSHKPRYLADRLGFLNQNNRLINRRRGNTYNIDFTLSRGREGMLYRGSKLFNSLDPSLKMESNEKKFKAKVKEWILDKIPQIPY